MPYRAPTYSAEDAAIDKSPVLYPSPRATAAARSSARRASRVTVRGDLDLTQPLPLANAYEQGLLIAISRLQASVARPLTVDDVLRDIRITGFQSDLAALHLLSNSDGAWESYLSFEPRWSTADWNEERDFLMGHHPVNDEDAYLYQRAHEAAEDMRWLLMCWRNDARRIAIDILRGHLDAYDCMPVGTPPLDVAVGGWPSTRHLRLHYLADRQGGWKCRDCGVGLVDVCSGADMLTDNQGGRYVAPESGKQLPTIDHEVPQSLGGSDLPENLALVCRPCNSRKGAA